MKSLKEYILNEQVSSKEYLEKIKTHLSGLVGITSITPKGPNGYIVRITGDRIEMINLIANSIPDAVYNSHGSGSSIGRVEIPVDGKTKTILVKGGTSGVANKGDIAEGLIAAGIFAKIVHRNTKQIVNITDSDIKDILSDMDDYGKLEVVHDIVPGVQDHIKLNLSLPKNALADLKDKNKWVLFPELFKSAVEYANSRNVTRYAKFLYRNGKPNKIEIRGVGTENQTGTKVDIVTYIDGRKTNLNISLKVTGGDQFGQVGGHSFKSLHDFFNTFGIDVPRKMEDVYNKRILEDDKITDAVQRQENYVTSRS